ncbi:MAG: ATP-binding protein [Bdellovibrionales bacterium]
MKVQRLIISNGDTEPFFHIFGDLIAGLGRAEIDRRIAAVARDLAETKEEDEGRFQILIRRFSLSESEALFLLLGLFAELDENADFIFRFYNKLDDLTLPTIQFALQLINSEPQTDWPLTADSPLLQFHLIDIFERPPVGKILGRFFRLNERVFRFLVGDNSAGGPIRACTAFHPYSTDKLLVSGPDSVTDLMGRKAVLVYGGNDDHRLDFARQLSRDCDLNTLVLKLAEVPLVERSFDLVGELFKETILTHSLLALDLGDEMRDSAMAQKIVSEAVRFGWPVVCLQKRHSGDPINDVIAVEVKNPAAQSRTFSQKDLIFAPEQEVEFRRVIASIRDRGFVLREWGFSQDFSTHEGVNVLFFGASGTGKTLSANVMAFELGRTMHKIELSSLISKYVGETEKNIEKVFKDLVGPSTLVLFDEAEALFAQRSEQKSSNDRFSNIEINYLLQRMEMHDGIVVLATNLERNIDPAFFRRFDYSIRFSLPAARERRRMWQSSFPARAPLGTIDFDLLAEKMKISGASIRKIALNAALSAKGDSGQIEMEHIVAAAEMEHKKMGLFFSNPLDQETH